MRNVSVCVCLLGTLANIKTYFCIFAVLFFCRRHIKLIRRAPFVFASLYSIYFAIPFAFLSLSLSLIALPNAARKSRQWFFSCSASLLVGAASYCRGTCYPPYTPPTPRPLCSYTSAAAAVDISRSWEFMFAPQRQVNELQQISPACGLLGGIYLFIYRVRCNKDTI